MFICVSPRVHSGSCRNSIARLRRLFYVCQDARARLSVSVFSVYNGRGQLNLLPLITRIVQDPEKRRIPFPVTRQ